MGGVCEWGSWVGFIGEVRGWGSWVGFVSGMGKVVGGACGLFHLIHLQAFHPNLVNPHLKFLHNSTKL